MPPRAEQILDRAIRDVCPVTGEMSLLWAARRAVGREQLRGWAARLRRVADELERSAGG